MAGSVAAIAQSVDGDEPIGRSRAGDQSTLSRHSSLDSRHAAPGSRRSPAESSDWSTQSTDQPSGSQHLPPEWRHQWIESRHSSTVSIRSVVAIAATSRSNRGIRRRCRGIDPGCRDIRRGNRTITRTNPPITLRDRSIVGSDGRISRSNRAISRPDRAIRGRSPCAPHAIHYNPRPMAKPETPNKVIYSMIGVSKFHDKKQVLKDIYLSYFYGAKIGVIGLNGSGKSSLLRILAGVDRDFIGETVLSPGYTIGFLEQEPQLDPTKTVREIVEQGVQETVDLLKEFDEINNAFGDPDADMDKLMERQGKVQDKLDAVGAWDLDSKLEMAMDALRCPPGETPVSILSGGEKRRVALCRLLLQQPDILLLDEPTNHLDAESVQWLEQHLKQYPGTIIAVTHDRYFLDNVAGWILELDRGVGIPYQGNYSSWLEQKKTRLQQEEKAESQRQKTLEHELEWIRMSPKGRHAKGKARITAYENLLNQQTQEKISQLEIYIPPGPRLGNVVVDADDVKKAFGDKLLMEEMTFKLPAGAIVGVIGPNGAGKTTLFRMIVGEDQPDGGKIKVGETVKLAYIDQSRTLDPNKSIFEEISGGSDIVTLGTREMQSRAYVARFNFNGQDQQKKVGALSGGERNRVHLAKMLKEGANVLLLDEPTNDLDVNTMRALEEAIENFAGCAIVISHDRWFLDRVATHILAFEGDSKVTWFDGNFSEYEEDKRKRLGADADQPHRIRYRQMTR
jgi:sulfate-transporting ATPase